MVVAQGMDILAGIVLIIGGTAGGFLFHLFDQSAAGDPLILTQFRGMGHSVGQIRVQENIKAVGALFPEHLIRRANLEKSFGHQLFSGKRKPSRDTVIQLAFAMRASVAQAQEMLKVARKSVLYPRIKRDTVIIYCLHNRVSLLDTEIILENLGLPILGGKDQ